MDRNYLTVPAAMFFNQFVVSPFRAFLVIVLDELGYTTYEIGLIVAAADLAALMGSIIGPAFSDFIGRKNSSALGRGIFASGLLTMFFVFGHSWRFIVALIIAQIGLLWGWGASYILVGETSKSRVSFSSYSLAINDFGGFFGLLLFVKLLDGHEAVMIFKEFMPIWSAAAFVSATLIFLSRETKRGNSKKVRPRIDSRLALYLLGLFIMFFGVAIYRTFSPLYAKKFVGVSDQLRGQISMIEIGLEGLFFLIVSRLNPSARKGLLFYRTIYTIGAIYVVLEPTIPAAIVTFALLAPVMNSVFRPSLWDFDMHITPEDSRGVTVSVIFTVRRLGLMTGRISGARAFVIDPRLVMLIPSVAIISGIGVLFKATRRE